MPPTRLARTALLVAALGAAPTAFATDRVPGRDRFVATARVVDVRPVYADVTVREPRLECTAGARRPDVRVHGARTGHRDAYRGERRHGHEARVERRVTDARGATIVGGLVGGAVGNRLARDGSRGERAAGTLAGALLGAGTARAAVRVHARDRYADRYGDGERHRYGHDRGYRHERCVRVVEVREERRLDHYEVTYTFRGRTFLARRDRDPGDTIRIDVSVAPSRR